MFRQQMITRATHLNTLTLSFFPLSSLRLGLEPLFYEHLADFRIWATESGLRCVALSPPPNSSFIRSPNFVIQVFPRRRLFST